MRMSGKRRNVIPVEKVRLAGAPPLPEIVQRSAAPRPSATSQRFRDIFYQAEWPSLSDTGTDSPDYIEVESSGSSASSMFSWADVEASRLVTQEWEKVQRTLYDEDGPKVTQIHLIEECEQWKQTFLHLRVVGHSYETSGQDYDKSYDTEEEVLALQYDSENDNATPERSFLVINGGLNQENNCQKLKSLRANPKSILSEKKPVTISNRCLRNKSSTGSLIEDLDSMLHITPITNAMPANDIHTFRSVFSSSIIKSEISSSRWRNRNTDSPDFVSLPHHVAVHPSTVLCREGKSRDNSATSIFSSTSKNCLDCDPKLWNARKSSTSDHKNQNSIRYYKNVKEKSLYTLEPLEAPLTSRTLPIRSITIPQSDDAIIKSGVQRGRNISLPPILADEAKDRRRLSQKQSDISANKSIRNNKQTLTPIDHTPNSVCSSMGVIENIPHLADSHLAVTRQKTSRHRKRNARKKN